MRRPKALLLDFDGVLSPNSIDLQRDWVMRRLAVEGVIGKGVLDDLVRSVSTSVRAKVSLDLLSLVYGVVWSEEDITSLQRHVMSSIVIDDAFGALLSACREESISIKIVSMASPRLLETIPGIDASMIFAPPGDSKANPTTFRALAASLPTPARDTLLVDDTPMVLRAAKLAGFGTALMRGSLYDSEDRAQHASYIDLCCDSLRDILLLVRS